MTYETFDDYSSLTTPLIEAFSTIEALITNAEEEDDPNIEKEIIAFNLLVTAALLASK